MAIDFSSLKSRGLKFSPVQKTGLTLLIDERQDRLDKIQTRTIISCVELDEKYTLDELEENIKAAIRGIIDISRRKLHFAELNTAEKVLVVDALSNLDFTSKVWIFYHSLKNPTEAKQRSLKLAIDSLKKKHSKRQVSFLVEHAADYKNIVRENFMTTNEYLSLLPDLICYVMSLKIDLSNILARIDDSKIRAGREAEILEMIRQVHEHIRLQTIHNDGSKDELARSNRL